VAARGAASALGSAVEGLASVIVVWRFTGSRTLSEIAERRAQRGVAVSFWLLAPYIAAESIRGTQNYLCAAQAAAVLLALAITAAWPGSWWIDPVIGLGIAAVSVREGIESWRGDDCCWPRHAPTEAATGR